MLSEGESTGFSSVRNIVCCDKEKNYPHLCLFFPLILSSPLPFNDPMPTLGPQFELGASLVLIHDEVRLSFQLHICQEVLED